jgi:quercetin dioxygenase-like cupin family protein
MNIRAIGAAVLALTLFGGACAPAHAQSQAKVARSEKLPNVPGKSVTAVVVTFPPGAKSPRHHHAGSVLVYVLSGEVRSENSATGPAKVYKAGETFFEPAGSAHLVSENVSATEPATILAVFIADDGATLTTIDQ